MSEEHPEAFLAILQGVKNKRAKIVVQHILQHGFITTETLENIYGYSHPPRAIRDVRELGIPIITFRVKAADGRTIAAYKFGDFSQIRQRRLEGRRTFPKSLKQSLYEAQQQKCAVCGDPYEMRYLQIDHRVPYEIAGDSDTLEVDTGDYMLLCGSCNRAKSWSCEQCPNWHQQLEEVCQSCYWASPNDYRHVATTEERRTDIRWFQSEVPLYDQLSNEAKSHSISLPEYIKSLLHKLYRRK